MRQKQKRRPCENGGKQDIDYNDRLTCVLNYGQKITPSLSRFSQSFCHSNKEVTDTDERSAFLLSLYFPILSKLFKTKYQFEANYTEIRKHENTVSSWCFLRYYRCSCCDCWKSRIIEITQQIKALSTKSNGLNTIPRTHLVEGENWLLDTDH